VLNKVAVCEFCKFCRLCFRITQIIGSNINRRRHVGGRRPCRTLLLLITRLNSSLSDAVLHISVNEGNCRFGKRRQKKTTAAES